MRESPALAPSVRHLQWITTPVPKIGVWLTAENRLWKDGSARPRFRIGAQLGTDEFNVFFTVFNPKTDSVELTAKKINGLVSNLSLGASIRLVCMSQGNLYNIHEGDSCALFQMLL